MNNSVNNRQRSGEEGKDAVMGNEQNEPQEDIM